MKIPLAVDLDIQGFSGSGITDYNSGMTNLIVGRNKKVTQRPSINVSEDSTTISGLNPRARGIYYWEVNAKNYIVNDDSLYEDTQSSTRIAENTGTFSGGTERCTMLETVGTNYLVILDAENDKGWVMTTTKTLDQIASNFPSTLVHGGAVLDGYLFVMDEDGYIYNSAVNDPTTFPSTGVLLAERDNDKGVYLGKHHDHIVAFGTRSIEFFYDAANASGSPLNRRTDISYRTGCASGLSVWEDSDVIYFMGSNSSGQLGVYKLENFQLTKISSDSIDSYFTQGLTKESLKVVFNGVSVMGHSTLLLTVYTLTGSDIDPKITLSFDSQTGIWGFWETTVNSNTTFPLMAWTKRTGGQNATVSARTGEGLMYNGDIISINDDFYPVDTVLGVAVYESGIYEADIYSSTSDNGTNVSVITRTGLFDGETSRYKFQGKETLECENTQNTQVLTIKHSDETSNSFGSGKNIDTSLNRKDAFRGGRFMKRNYQLEYAGDEQIFMEYLDVDIEAGL